MCACACIYVCVSVWTVPAGAESADGLEVSNGKNNILDTSETTRLCISDPPPYCALRVCECVQGMRVGVGGCKRERARARERARERQSERERAREGRRKGKRV